MKKVFLTVGVQLPFDRLVEIVRGFESVFEIRGQVGESSLRLSENYKNFIDEKEYQDNVLWADAIIAHAGMGSVLTALEFKKKIFIMPRLAELREHRNNHQLDTVKYLRTKQDGQNIFTVAETSEKLCEALIDYSKFSCENDDKYNIFESRCSLIEFLKNEI